MKINQIIAKIDENQLFVPAFQREYVWKRENAKDLISSLIKRYPTGTMLTWDTNNPPELKGQWKYDPRQGAVKIILDGQQRITTLYLLIRNQIPPYYKESEILNDPRNLYINIKTTELQYYKKTMMDGDPYWINITHIFQKQIRANDIVRSLQDKGITPTREEEDVIYDNFSAVQNIPDAEFIEQAIPVEANLKEAIDIFYIVNASGVNLTDAELALAQISGYWPEARVEFKTKIEELKQHGFCFKLDFIVYCLLGIMYNLGSDMTKLHTQDNEERLKTAWDKLKTEVLDYLVNLLRTNAFVDHTNEINSVYALVPMVAYIYKRGKDALTQDDINKMIKWFYYSQIRQRYVSQLPQKLDKDLGIVSRSENPFDELLNLIKLERPLEITPEEFVGVDIRNALYSLMRWYFKSQNAVCLTTGVGIRQNMGKKYQLEWDHIFPYSILRNRGYNLNNRAKYSLAQEVTNRVVLTQVANRRKSDKLPNEYLEGVNSRYPHALKLQLVPENKELWQLDRFEDFIAARRILLTEHLNKFLNSICQTTEVVGKVSILDLIQDGESNELEMKSSMRWDYQQGRIDKKMEQVILKTISALSNSDGGVLIIGVSDEGEILGLDNDYQSLNGTKDEFELHLRDLVKNEFGTGFSATNLQVSFESYDDKEVCKVEVQKGIKPLYLQVIDKNGQKQDKFYIRDGNSSKELGLTEIGDYLKFRFK